MDPETNFSRTRLDLSSIDSYKKSSLILAENKLKTFFGDISCLSLKDVKDKQQKINSYPNIDSLQPLKTSEIFILDEDKIDIKKAELAVLEGKIFWEHAAAGEATRLGLGTKYCLDLTNFSKQEIIDLIKNEAQKEGNTAKLEELPKISEDLIDPKSLLPLSLGARHMVQMVYDLKNLAKKYGLDQNEILEKQKMLIILNQKTAQRIIDEIRGYNFFSFKPENVYFMVQQTFHGISINEDRLSYDDSFDNKRLHNHGQMAMQKLHDNSIFHYIDGNRKFLTSQEYLDILSQCQDMISYNIEDIGYLTSSIDFSSLSLALQLGRKGFNMVMEIVGQNPIKPQKGGAAFFDPILNKNIMIENNMLNNYDIKNIKYLNKNFNHYPNPAIAMKKIKSNGISFMPIDIKNKNDKEFLYFCPVQGDINFLVNTAFVMRKDLKSIQNWKSPATTPPTLMAMKKQEELPGFKNLIQEFGLL